jgi:hypothetical protein
MASPLPHNHAIKEDLGIYVKDAEILLSESVVKVGKDSSFTNIYKVALASHSVVEALHAYEHPSFLHISEIIQRIPIHVLTSQKGSARVDLRRLIELYFLTLYFSDHPVEWDSLIRNPTRVMAHEKESPILANAHREPSYYRAYAKERFSREISGHGLKAVEELATAYGLLSDAAHAPTATSDLDINAAINILKPAEISQIAVLFQQIAANVCIVAAGYACKQFDELQPAHRAWFDWLVGQSLAKSIRSGRFGLPKLGSS